MRAIPEGVWCRAGCGIAGQYRWYPEHLYASPVWICLYFAVFYIFHTYLICLFGQYHRIPSYILSYLHPQVIWISEYILIFILILIFFFIINSFTPLILTPAWADGRGRA